MAALLEVEDLSVTFAGDEGRIRAVEHVSFALARNQTLCIVGESGCGKSVTALAIMGLLAKSASREGRVDFDGSEITALDPSALNALRGARIAMIFQEPMTSLNPAFTVGDQIVEAIRHHRGGTRAEAKARAIEMLKRVRIPAPERRFSDYPHKLSGGMRQRVMIAMALACDPELLIADEPTTALDVTIQAQVLDLMRKLRAETGAAIMLITHDLGVVAEMADRVIVMYAGQIVEEAPVGVLFSRPEHPYTVGLLGSIPRLDRKRGRLPAIEGTVPSPLAMPPGCRFAPRCPFADARCRTEPPSLRAVAPEHWARCWKSPLAGLVA
jgi:oligopeptide/dipeptide ABC transporter ATP-binding protein